MLSLRKIKKAVLVFLFLLLICSLLRVWFYFLYYSGADLADTSVLKLWYWGVRMDFTILFYVNIPFLFFWLLVADHLRPRISRLISLSLLLLVNVPLIALNMIDLAYFRFNGHRSTTDLLSVAGDSMQAFPGMLLSFWYLTLAFLVIVAGMVWVLRKILTKDRQERSNLVIGYILAIVFGGLLYLLARGTDGRPIFPSTPLLHFRPEFQPLVNNSGFTFLYSVIKRQDQLTAKNYYSEAQANSLLPIVHHYPQTHPFVKKNVVVIILESFCKEFFEEGNPLRSRVPFLDSLRSRSTWCENAYANGIASNQGIVAILGSIPSFLDQPYFHSVYSSNRLRGIGTILKEKGYSTHFYMGAGPDHFGFGKFCKMVGIDQYHSGEEFGDNRYHDGVWGIRDDQFLPHVGEQLQRQPSPFLAVLFNLSSHFPFELPEEVRKDYAGAGALPIQQTAAYVDHSLQLFFNRIKDTDWYNNTLFVITADHSAMGFLDGGEWADHWRSFRIPMFIHDPADPVLRDIRKPVQQLDLVPEILDRLHYDGRLMAFGTAFRDSAERVVVNREGNIIQVVDEQYLLGYDEKLEKVTWLYDVRNDPGLKKDLKGNGQHTEAEERLKKYVRAEIQQHNNKLIMNKLYVE